MISEKSLLFCGKRLQGFCYAELYFSPKRIEISDLWLNPNVEGNVERA